MTKKALVADDDLSMRKLLIQALELIGISDTVEATDGDKALGLCQENEFDVILLDQNMPGKTGVEVARAIRASGSRVPILMVTAETNRDQVLEAIHTGVSDYLVKPFDNSVLRDKLTKLCHAGDVPNNVAVYRARNVMKTGVVTIQASTTVGDAMKTLLDHGVSGLPVVGDHGEMVGIITEHQLLQLIYSPEIKDEKISDHMTKDVLTAKEESDLADVAHMMEQNRVRRIPVVRNGQVVGIIARRDLLRYVSENEDVLKEFLASAQKVPGVSAQS